MIRTQIVPCKLNNEICDSLNLASGRIYSGIVSRHWRLLKQKGLWLKEKSLTRLSDIRPSVQAMPLHAHSIDAAQQGFFKACVTTRALRKAHPEGSRPEANFPWRSKKFRTTIWKTTAIKFENGTIRLSNGQGNRRIEIAFSGQNILKVLEVRLVFDKQSRKYNWHIVLENGMQPKQPRSNNVVSVDPGEIHPAVVGDEHSATIITGRERRAKQRGHAKALKFFSKALAKKKKGSKRYKRLVRAKTRCKAKNRKVMRDIEHKISRAIVAEARLGGHRRDASTIAYGDICNIADGIDKGKKHNQHMSQLDHGKVCNYVEYKAAAEGIVVVLQNEAYTSKTCPSCGNKHKPRGRKYKCPSCGFSGHRDVVGQINLLSNFKFGEPGKIPLPTNITYRIPYNVRVMRKWADTPLAVEALSPVAQPKQLLLFA